VIVAAFSKARSFVRDPASDTWVHRSTQKAGAS
jgi:hypothetical protein